MASGYQAWGVLENRLQNLEWFENLDKPAFSPQSDNSFINISNQAYIGGKELGRQSMRRTDSDLGSNEGLTQKRKNRDTPTPASVCD